ncbi:MAG TPA: divalent-cation tolerance protein CutA [Patescibacteria group bacterium]|nr:divalent-cation tolerance protein CutA [Patescibacteria group bacterium]
MSHSLIYATAPNRAAALKIARVLVECRLVACANVVDGATSLYWWEGQVQEEVEAILVAKTTSANASATVAKIKELHDYSCPCVVALDIAQGNLDFLGWITAETRPAV